MTDQILPWISEQLLAQTKAAFNNTHAILINGPAYIGKSNLAVNVCKRLLQQPSSIQSGTHPDLHLLTSAYSLAQLDEQLRNSAFRYLDTKALEKKRLSRQIGVGTIRSLTFAMSESSALEGNKLALIYPAEQMNRNAANALLKFLEEPTDQTLIILISHDISKLPATIRSRCMRIDIVPPIQSESVSWLQTVHSDQNNDEIYNALQLASGRPLLANRYLTDSQQSIADKLADDIEEVINGNANIVSIARSWLKLKQTDFILHWLCCFFSDLIKHKSGDCSKAVAKSQNCLVKQLAINDLFDLYDYFVSIKQRYDGVADETLLLEDLLLKISTVRQ